MSDRAPAPTVAADNLLFLANLAASAAALLLSASVWMPGSQAGWKDPDRDALALLVGCAVLLAGHLVAGASVSNGGPIRQRGVTTTGVALLGWPALWLAPLGGASA